MMWHRNLALFSLLICIIIIMGKSLLAEFQAKIDVGNLDCMRLIADNSHAHYYFMFTIRHLLSMNHFEGKLVSQLKRTDAS